MEQQVFKVKLEAFEGPLDLLLNLIEKHKLSISTVSLAKVADDYLLYISELNDFPMAESADFILTASTLVLIKSKSLLPTLALTDEESGNIEDLQQRLALYQSIRETSKKLQTLFGDTPLYFQSERQAVVVFSPHEAISPANLLGAGRSLIAALPKFDKLPKAIVQKVISLEEMIMNLSERITKTLRMSFREFSCFGKKEKVHVIVGFLAMLELVKRGAIRVVQDSDFKDITIETDKNLSIPKYS